MKVTFPGGKRVDAFTDGFTIATDQLPMSGGEGLAPEPFTLFLASIATCAGIYIKGFCDQRGIDASSIELYQDLEYNPVKRMISVIQLEIKVPTDFPMKYDRALVQTAGLCAVKRHLHPDVKFQGFVTRPGETIGQEV
jgi:ribosomal protein S12 methylthiotransferase accessory factor